jgi:pimeloyl-ACP methyl ester carboxylesterase
MTHLDKPIGKADGVNPKISGLAEEGRPSDPAFEPSGRPSYLDAIPKYGLGVKAVAVMDLELRTALASLIAVSAIPGTFLRGSGSQHRAAAEFYADLARGRDISAIFPAPEPGVPMRARHLGRLPWAPRVVNVDTLSFESPYEVQYPAVRASYESHTRNSIARAMHWRHDDGPRPTIIVVHGFTGSPYWFNSGFFSLPWVYGNGCDVVLAILPFHGRRNDRGAPYSGSGLFSDGVATFTEAMFQSVCDLRVIIDYLESTGVANIGITGLSLGGYVTALMAAVEPRLHFAIPNSAVVEMPSLIDSWFPAGQLVKAGLRMGSIDRDVHEAAMRIHSPLSYPAALPKHRLFIVGGLADRLAPPEQSARLWEHWGRPRIHWFPGSHIIHLRRASYLREIGRFLRETGFSPG